MRTFALLCALAATTSLAQEGPCKADKQKLCASVARGPAMRECMKAHAAELSEGCKQALLARRAAKKPGQSPAPVAP